MANLQSANTHTHTQSHLVVLDPPAAADHSLHVLYALGGVTIVSELQCVRGARRARSEAEALRGKHRLAATNSFVAHRGLQVSRT